MSIIVTCMCGRSLRLRDEYAGDLVRCPACQQVFCAPGGDLVTPPPELETPSVGSAIPNLEIGPPAQASEPEPSVFGLAPEEGPEEAPRQAPPRPPRASEERDEPRELTDVSSRRRIRKTSGGLLRPGTWKLRPALDVGAAVLLLSAAALLFVSLINLSRYLIRHEGSRPPSPTLIVVGVAAAVLLLVLGGLWFIFRLVFRER
jgi:hypothetical protein